ncbi:MAG TPA: hypothetical protein VFA27_02065 [Vicinamibacterales bacterium]|nr:hypothetical protein [Vicinamibacterales bacterium]
MRNDARPLGHDEPPIPDVDTPKPTGDSRDSVTHDRQSHIINRGAEENARRDDADVDPVMPTGDSSLRTNI